MLAQLIYLFDDAILPAGLFMSCFLSFYLSSTFAHYRRFPSPLSMKYAFYWII